MSPRCLPAVLAPEGVKSCSQARKGLETDPYSTQSPGGATSVDGAIHRYQCRPAKWVTCPRRRFRAITERGLVATVASVLEIPPIGPPVRDQPADYHRYLTRPLFAARETPGLAPGFFHALGGLLLLSKAAWRHVSAFGI